LTELLIILLNICQEAKSKNKIGIKIKKETKNIILKNKNGPIKNKEVKPRIKNTANNAIINIKGTIKEPSKKSLISPAVNFPGFSFASLIIFLILKTLNIIIQIYQIFFPNTNLAVI